MHLVVLFLILLASSAGISLVLAFFARRHRTTPGDYAFALVLYGESIWSTGYFFELMSPTVSGKVILDNLEFIGTDCIAIGSLLFALGYTGHGVWVHRLTRLLWVLPVLNLVVVWTDPFHHLLRTSITTVPSATFAFLSYGYGPWMWFFMLYGLGFVLGSIVILLSSTPINRYYQLQTLAVILGMSAPLLGSSITMAGLVPLPELQNLDLSPIAFAIANPIWAWGLFRRRLLDLVPIARDMLVEQMPDGLIVLDLQLRIIDVNPGAQVFLNRSMTTLIGLPIGSVLPSCASVFPLTRDWLSFEAELPVGSQSRQPLWVEITISRVNSRQNGILGWLVVLRDRTAHHHMQVSLCESERKLATLLSNLPGMAYRCLNDCSWTMEFVSQGCSDLTGYPPESIINNAQIRFSDIIHPNDHSLVWKQVQAALQQRQPFQVSYRIIARDGQEKWVWEQGRGIFTDAGDLLALEGLITDITERKQAEEALRTSEAQYRLLAETMSDVVWTMNTEGQFTYVSPSVYALRGYTPEEVLLQTMAEALMPESLQVVLKRVEAFQRTGILQGARLELEQPCKNGSTVWTECVTNPLRDESGTLTGWVGVSRDITARKRVEDELRKLSRAVEQSSVSVVITDTNGTIEYVNPWFTHVTGYTFAEARGQNPRILKSGTIPLEVYQDLWQTILSGKEWCGEFHNKKKNGALYWEFASISPVFNEEGTITHLVAVKEDITERKCMEVELHRARESAEAASRAKSIFLANMSHELRTPLNAILGFAQLMHRIGGLPPEYQANVEIIYRSGEHLLSLINSVLDLSKIESGRMVVNKSSCNLSGLLNELEDMFRLRAHEKRLRLTFEPAPNLPRYISTDEMKLRQVLINLLSNAIKFTTTGRVILRVTTKHDDQRLASNDWQPAICDQQPGTNLCQSPVSGQLSAVGAYTWLNFAVEDSGPGIAPEELDTLFDAFTQTQSGQQKLGGTGLGLTISRKFVRLLGGDIYVQSQLGRGTVFTFTIPVIVEAAPDTLRQEVHRSVVGLAPDQPSYRILIVDDLRYMRVLLHKLLAPLGFEIREASNGQEALKIWEQWKPHLIWMDMRMPEMDGYEATRRIKALPGGTATRIIALTASAFEEERAEVLAAGCDDFMHKPFRIPEIFTALQKHLGVRYVYADELLPSEPDDATFLNTSDNTACATALGYLPADLLANLEQAAICLDMTGLNRLIAQITTYDLSLATALQSLADDFAYDQILMSIREYRRVIL